MTRARPLKKKYLVSGYLTISVFKVIEADSPEDAKAKAEDLACPSLCHQCDGAGENDKSSWTLNGFDGPPEGAVRYVSER